MNNTVDIEYLAFNYIKGLAMFKEQFDIEKTLSEVEFNEKKDDLIKMVKEFLNKDEFKEKLNKL